MSNDNATASSMSIQMETGTAVTAAEHIVRCARPDKHETLRTTPHRILYVSL